MQPTPTGENYATLQNAYDAINVSLFGGDLPQCMIILSKKARKAAGYYAPKRYQGAADDNSTQVIDEIAINPHIMRADKIEVLATLAHEMAHLWQYHFGKPTRAGYHNKEWAAKMDAIGLTPSSTGKPGGKRTGQSMADYPAPGGPFEKWAKKWLAGNSIRWGSSDLALRMEGILMVAQVVGGSCDEGEAAEQEPIPTKPKSKVKYSCSNHNAWGKPGLALHCNECKEDMQAAE